MNHNVPDEVEATISLEKFFEQLTWEKLERRIRVALYHPEQAVPLEINCPAVMDLAKQVMGKIGESAIRRPGERVCPEEIFTFDQRLIIFRIIEAVIAEYEEYKNTRIHGKIEQVWNEQAKSKLSPIHIRDQTWGYIVRELGSDHIFCQTDNEDVARCICEAFPKPAVVIRTVDNERIYYN